MLNSIKMYIFMALKATRAAFADLAHLKIDFSTFRMTFNTVNIFTISRFVMVKDYKRLKAKFKSYVSVPSE